MSLYAREKGAFRRRLRAADSRSSHGVACRELMRGDGGFGLIEIVVSMILFAIIALPITHVIVTTQYASNTLHLRAEAADLATQALKTAQYQMSNGVNPTAGITTTTQYSGNDIFTVSLDWELAAGAGTDGSVCVAPLGQLTSQIWTLKATVNWGTAAQRQSGNDPGQRVVETTLISPSEADLASTNSAEIAVPVFTAADNQNLETATPIPMTATGTCTLGSGNCGTVPSNDVTTETVNSGSTGCAVFTNLFAGAGETYNITVSPPNPYVDPTELFWNPGTTNVLFIPPWRRLPMR